MKENFRKIDVHSHVAWMANGVLKKWNTADLVEAADKLGIEKLLCSTPIIRGPSTMEMVRKCNEATYEAMKEYPDKILGYAFVDPGYFDEAIKEVERCVNELGMIGVKLYNQYRADEPVVLPLIRKTAEMQIPVLWHAGHPPSPEEALKWGQPRVSDGMHIAILAKRVPDAILINGHIGGGGDWEWSIKALRNVPNVYVDTSGSVVDEGMIEMCVRYLGAERVLFGTDLSMEAGVGKILGADLTNEQRELIFWKNIEDILRRRKI
ncbi:amidohydrolase [Candidatus Bathyarchaeota archaeon]|nr:MAG: amidohydrolase [Candidatus Bathyarchaeota archaeon]